MSKMHVARDAALIEAKPSVGKPMNMMEPASDSLLWIKDEIENSLVRARQALERFAEPDGHRDALADCTGYLHQVVGTLAIVEITGATRLAEEMEALARELGEAPISRRDDALDALMRALLKLPDYLDRLACGQREMPLTLLSLLNELRTLRGQQHLSEAALFAPEPVTPARLPVESLSPVEGVDMRAVARELRPRYQAALLSWFKDDAAKNHLESLGAITAQLERAAATPPVFELWWILGGVIDALVRGGLEPSVPIKQLLGQTDRQIKRLIEDGESAVAEAPPRELVNTLLYYVAHASSSGERVECIKETFGLDTLTQEQGAESDFEGPDVDLVQTVAAEIKEDIARIKDALDIFVRTGHRDTSELAPTGVALEKVSNTLAMLELNSLRADLEPQQACLGRIIAGELSLEEGLLMRIAEALIVLDNRLDAVAAGIGNSTMSLSGVETRNADAGSGETFKAVIRESLVNLKRVKDAVLESVSHPERRVGLEAALEHIAQIPAGLRFIDSERAVPLLDSICALIREEALDCEMPPHKLDRMADAVVGIELYLEALAQDRYNPDALLVDVETSVADLGFPVQPMSFEVATSPVSGREVKPLVAVESMKAKAAIATAEVNGSAPAERMQPTLSVDHTVHAERSNSPSVRGASESASDPEIVALFLEEAREESTVLAKQFPRWRDKPACREALVTVRRSFHTLKGSGRMAGAVVVSEFAWALEDMLNRVSEADQLPSASVFVLVEEAIAILPTLIETLSSDAQSELDVTGIVSRANALARGKSAAVDMSDGTAKEEQRREGAPQRVAVKPLSEARQVFGVTPVSAANLNAVFSREVATHLEVLADFLAGCRVLEVACPVSDSAVRALHTLHGSAAMAGAMELARLVEPAERYFTVLQKKQIRMPHPDVALLDTFVKAIRALLDAFVNADETLPDYSPLSEEFNRLTGLAEADALAMQLSVDMPAEDTLDSAVAPPDFTGAGEDYPTSKRGPVDGSHAPETSVLTGRAATDLSAATIAHEPERSQDSGQPMQFAELPLFDPEIAEIFFGEAEELLDAIDEVLDGWSREGERLDLVMVLQRHLHTLKGGARMAGLIPMGDLSHALESLLIETVDGRIVASEELFRLLYRAVDRLHRMLGACAENCPAVDISDLITAFTRLTDGDVKRRSTREAAGQKVISGVREGQSDMVAEQSDVTGSAVSDGFLERREGSRVQSELVKVRADLLENALNQAGEVSIFRTRLEQQINSMGFSLAELDQTVVRLREQLRNLEIETEAEIIYQFEQDGGNAGADAFDPLELDRYSQVQQLSRALAESVDDLVSIQTLLTNHAHECESVLLQQSRVTTDLQDNLMGTRMVPFSRYAQRLRRIVRQTAEEVGKRAELTLVGAEGEMDRQVLERVLAPLEHVLRNAVIHGVELPEERRAAGKTELGGITIGVSRESSEVIITVMDDGCGLHLQTIRSKAESLGLVAPGDSLNEAEIMQLILEPGFSTADVITQSAGRGVGMNVVASEIKQLGGTLAINSLESQGTRFTIRLPFTLAITQALLVNVADALYAIALPSIEGIARIPRRDLESYLKKDGQGYAYGGHHYRLQHLSVLLGLGAVSVSESTAQVPLLLVRSGDRYSALITEGLQGSREIVVKSVGPQVSSIRGIAGATILGDGSILPILDVAALVRAAAHVPTRRWERALVREDQRPVAMVVDDSITVRRITKRFLERHGLRVVTAKDGLDALALLQESVPDVLLLDIEMPRMDGYELATHIRNDERFRKLPVIMITSRTGEKHRQRAVELGISHYLGKPYQERELLGTIHELIGEFHREPPHGTANA